jgi:hypothetical protein
MNDEMQKALAGYRGPVTKLPDGRVGGAGDLQTWAQRRSGGRSGVPDAGVQRKQAKIAKKRERRYRRFKESGAHLRMSFQQFLGVKPGKAPRKPDSHRWGPPPWE